ncbi:MAG: triose-phosphate isomerase [Candidatus Pacebacteria bacterium]|nr:triose-phosphate isomerase [Candidatus Paceibacterota bacterium]
MKNIIIANWKCNPENLEKAGELLAKIKDKISDLSWSGKIDVVICPPFPYIACLNMEGTDIKLGAQDCFWEDKGAYTGEVSPLMLEDIGCKYVIIGHSERRKYQKETDQMINSKVKASLLRGLKTVLCIEGSSQIKDDLKDVSKESMGNLILAFEPIFAIGTGKPCSVDLALKENTEIRKIIGDSLPILYGGSVNSSNAKDYIEKANYNGLLIGGASLNPEEFFKIIASLEG